jgi:hypothetical protein
MKGALWETMEDDRTWMVNPGKRRRKRGRRNKARKRTRRARRNGGMVAPLINPRRKRRRSGGQVMARRKGGKRRRRGGFRRNPPFRAAGMLRRLQQGVKDALYVTAGDIGAGFVNGFLYGIFPAGKKPTPGSITDLALQGVTAVLIAEVGGRFIKGDATRFVVAGALAKPVRALVQSVMPAGALASYAPMLGMIPTLTRGPSFEGPRLSDNVLDGDAVMQGY